VAPRSVAGERGVHGGRHEVQPFKTGRPLHTASGRQETKNIDRGDSGSTLNLYRKALVLGHRKNWEHRSGVVGLGFFTFTPKILFWEYQLGALGDALKYRFWLCVLSVV
jgi:hypothetical protein